MSDSDDEVRWNGDRVFFGVMAGVAVLVVVLLVVLL
jgi:hypothetical protein